MSQHIYIWNSMARRRRSASDIFEENGVQILKAHLIANGHSCTVFDWATKSGFNRLSPVCLRILNHLLVYIALVKKPTPVWKNRSLRIQNKLGDIQQKRLESRLIKLAKNIARKNIRVAGIKVWYGEAFAMSKFFTQQVQKYAPETIVIAGGYHASLYEEDILKNSNFDLAVSGSGEEPLLQILQYIKENNSKGKQEILDTLSSAQNEKPIPGLIYRKKDVIHKSENHTAEHISGTIPLYPKNSGKMKVHILLESLGCPWNACNFCVHNKFSTGYHTRDISAIVDEMKAMIKQEIALFRFAGSDTPPSYGKKIARAILDHQLKIEYTMGCRAVKNCHEPTKYKETVNAFTLMIQSGLRGIFMGGETGNDIINDKIMNKGIGARDIVYTIKALREAELITKIKCTVSLAMIYPTPTTDTVDLDTVEKDNLRLIKETAPDAVMVSPPGPFKNTQWYCKAEEFGFEFKDNFIARVMEYEYVLFKPLDLWPEVPFTLKGMDFMEMLHVSQQFKNKIESELAVPTDLSDEHFLMIRTSGELSKQRIQAFKGRSQLSIISSNYSYLSKIERGVNKYSKNLALRNELN